MNVYLSIKETPTGSRGEVEGGRGRGRGKGRTEFR